MFILNFHHTQIEAFVHGFVKGLGAPAVLFHNEPAPTVPQVVMVSAPQTPIDQVLPGDWRKIGSDFDTVIAANGKTTSPTKTNEPITSR